MIKNTTMRKKGLKPIIDKNTEILILGSLPSDKSIKKQQYYANPGNDFWRLLENAINIKNLADFEYEDKIDILKKHKIGLWDVFKSSERLGSLDFNIKNGEGNNFSILKNKAPNLKLICFNGKKAGKYKSHIKENVDCNTKILFSSSGANRQYEKDREDEWKSAINYINQ